jgi:hypothetical protein
VTQRLGEDLTTRESVIALIERAFDLLGVDWRFTPRGSLRASDCWLGRCPRGCHTEGRLQMSMKIVPIALIVLLAAACSDDSGGGPDAGGDGPAAADGPAATDGPVTPSDTTGSDAGPKTCSNDQSCGAGRACVGARCVDTLRVWPNAASKANSDPWLPNNHAKLLQLRPRILALNFVNAKSNAQMRAHLKQITDAMAEASRPRGYADKQAGVMLRYEVAYAVDLRDKPPPAGWTLNNSTIYPREQPKQGYWSFDYAQLFTQAFAKRYNIPDPTNPSLKLDLCQLINRGLVHEVWVYGDADKPDASAAEILELKPRYDVNRKRVAGQPLYPCAGNGCFDAEDVATLPMHCTRTVRIGWVNNTRGPGCFIESLSHGFERTGNATVDLIPYIKAHFPDFAGMNLDTKYGLSFSSWYSCPNNAQDCLSYPSPTSVNYKGVAGKSGTLQGYVPVCGNVHFAPNARRHYDLTSSFAVQSTCEGYRQGGGAGGKDLAGTFTSARFAPYKAMGQDCMGAFLIYWWQNMPGPGSPAKDIKGQPMLSWIPFIYY